MATPRCSRVGAVWFALLSLLFATGGVSGRSHGTYIPDPTESLHSPEWLQSREMPVGLNLEADVEKCKGLPVCKPQYVSVAVVKYHLDPPKLLPEYNVKRPWLHANDISPPDLHAAFRKETGLRRIIETYEKYLSLRNEGDELMEAVMGPTSEAAANPKCRKRTQHVVGDAWDSIVMAEEDGKSEYPLCVQPEDLSGRFKPTSLDEFLRAKPLPLNVSGGRERYNHGGFPFFDAYGLKKLADFRYETHSFLFGAYLPPNLNRYFGKRFFNRSLIYWPLTGRDLITLKENLHRFTGPFFLMMSGSDYPEFPNWLLEHPFVLRIFTPNVPRELQHHPKLIAVPLGVRFTTTAETNNQRTNASVILPTEPLMASFMTHDKHKHGKKRGPSERVHRRRAVLDNLRDEWGLNRTITGTKKSQEEYAEGVLKHKFIISPPGHGLDTYRLWQVLSAGRVPVVKTLLPHDMLDNLPVWSVKEWKDVTRAGLEERWKKMHKLKFNAEKVWHPWWVRFILRECLAASDPV